MPTHFFFPGPVDSIEAERGHGPSVIPDFNGVIDGAELNLTGTGTNTTSGQSDRYDFDIDIRFMQGTFIGADARQHRGTFLFV